MQIQTDIRNVQSEAKTWLFEAAAPLWSTTGVCSDGLFAERIDASGGAVPMDRRLRVQARQIYSFCQLGRLGWHGPWRGITTRALDIFLTKGIRTDGLCVHMFDDKGEVISTALDLYDHAFGLFALAHAGKALGRDDALVAAAKMRDAMQTWQRPEGGYWEGELTPCPPYRQNPHMHLFEAALANGWTDMADALRHLFSTQLWEPQTGAVTEYFDRDWLRLPGEAGAIVEPGHCLEWAWLLDPFDKRLSDGLTAFARRHGIDPTRGVAINEVSLEGKAIDASARLWPQTERLKAAIVRYNRLRTTSEGLELTAAWTGLKHFFTTPVAGLWYDRMLADASFKDEAAPASSFYHIVCALNELIRLEV
jgi:mannose/cellobiose epimerase-like protein (N-acyl-D-glucosamine 2-epimerase family)